MKYFENKLVYITGGSSGIGLSTANLLVKSGASVVIFARNQKKLLEVKKNLELIKKNDLQKIFNIQIDVSNNEDVQKIIPATIKKIGIPDIIINCAGIGYSANFDVIEYDKYKQIFDINVFGTRNINFAIIPFFKKHGGHIVNVSSVAGLIGIYGYSAYGASKFAVFGMSEAMRSELKSDKISVSVLCPPEVDTPLLQEEAKTIRPEAKAVKLMTGVLDTKTVAKILLKGIRKNKFVIIPGAKAKFIYFLYKLFPNISRLFTDFIIKLNKIKER